MNEVEAYLRQAALLRGMDPDAVIRVVNTEGGVNDPFRQSLVKKGNLQEPSYGPLQLLIGGAGTGFPEGLGNQALKAGIDPRKDWKGGIDFGLDTAAREGWGQWYGPKNAGLDRWYGLKGAKPRGISLAGMPADGPKGQEMYPMAAPALPPPRNIADRFVKGVNDVIDSKPVQDFSGFLSKLNGGADGTGFADLAAAFGGGSSGSSAPQIQPSGLGAAVSNEIAAKSSSAAALMQEILKKRRGGTPGLSLMGMG